MTLPEFVEKYYLHDSNIENVKYDIGTRTLLLKINFAFWMQDWYDEKKYSETGILETTFRNVKNYHCSGGNPAGPFVTILKSELKDKYLVISFFDDDANKGIEMVIDAETVEILELPLTTDE